MRPRPQGKSVKAHHSAEISGEWYLYRRGPTIRGCSFKAKAISVLSVRRVPSRMILGHSLRLMSWPGPGAALPDGVRVGSGPDLASTGLEPAVATRAFKTQPVCSELRRGAFKGDLGLLASEVVGVNLRDLAASELEVTRAGSIEFDQRPCETFLAEDVRDHSPGRVLCESACLGYDLVAHRDSGNVADGIHVRDGRL